MIKAFKRWLAKAAYDGLQQPKEEARISRMYDMLSECGVAIVAFQIDNGFVVRTMNRHNDSFGSRNSGFVYCADHQAIADHIVTSAMVRKLGVQSDMFEKEKEAAVRQYASTQARGPVATQSRI
ncbi:hypothetical protein [Cutibacterium sp.]|uniref:hypothetical protein n=1 Tax=Cutibacterium sp. TaxID=1912221 RepID=UPI002588F3AF|nr:hypothetical protein [Cutibacterium sp.]MCA3768955.1 hypothetical protein [Cutibacterium sp.]